MSDGCSAPATGAPWWAIDKANDQPTADLLAQHVDV